MTILCETLTIREGKMRYFIQVSFNCPHCIRTNVVEMLVAGKIESLVCAFCTELVYFIRVEKKKDEVE